MELRRQYLKRVAFWLPTRCRSEIITTIGDDLEEYIDEIERERGKSLTADEEREALRQFCHPPVVATRYGKQRPLVSGGLMTVYRRVLTIAVLGVVFVQLLVLAPDFASAAPGEHGSLLIATGATVANGLALAFTVVTLVFAALTRAYWHDIPSP